MPSTPGKAALLHPFVTVTGLAISLAASACSSKDRPPPLVDDMITRPDVGFIPTTSDDSGSGVGTGNGALFEKCVADVKSQRGVVADPWLCFATTEGHPAASSVYRNLLYPAIAFGFHLDETDNKLETRLAYGFDTWEFDVTAPAGQMLAGGMYSTGTNDGSAIHFKWNTGSCGTDPESGIFQIFGIAWGADNVLTTVEIDFEHHCGLSSALFGRLRLHSSRL